MTAANLDPADFGFRQAPAHRMRSGRVTTRGGTESSPAPTAISPTTCSPYPPAPSSGSTAPSTTAASGRRIGPPHRYVYGLDENHSWNTDQARELATALFAAAAELDGCVAR